MPVKEATVVERCGRQGWTDNNALLAGAAADSCTGFPNKSQGAPQRKAARVAAHANLGDGILINAEVDVAVRVFQSRYHKPPAKRAQGLIELRAEAAEFTDLDDERRRHSAECHSHRRSRLAPVLAFRVSVDDAAPLRAQAIELRPGEACGARVGVHVSSHGQFRSADLRSVGHWWLSQSSGQSKDIFVSGTAAAWDGWLGYPNSVRRHVVQRPGHPGGQGVMPNSALISPSSRASSLSSRLASSKLWVEVSTSTRCGRRRSTSASAALSR